MNVNTQTLIELLVGLVGLISGAAGFSSYLTSTSIKHSIIAESQKQKAGLVTLRRRVKLLEDFAVNNGFQKSSTAIIATEDTDL